MAIKKHLKDLEAKLKHLKEEPAQNWIGKWAKSVKVHNIEKKIASLNKELIKRKTQ